MPLKILLADRKLGAASKLAFLQLWEFAGEQPGRVVVTADWLGSTCGRSPKAAWLWLEELQSHDLLKIGERNERRGTVVVDLYNPCPGNRAANTDSQERLPLDLPPCEIASGSEVSTPQPPTPLIPKKVQELRDYLSTKAFKESKDSTDSLRLDPAAAVAATMIGGDDAEQKARLKLRIQKSAGRETPVAEWVAGSAANLVVYHDVPIEEINRILGDVDAMRAVGSLRHAGMFLHAKFRELALRLGKPWPRSEVKAR